MRKRKNKQRPNQKLSQSRRKALRLMKEAFDVTESFTFGERFGKIKEIFEGESQVEAEDVTEAAPEQAAEETTGSINLDSLTKAELVELCTERNVDYRKSWNKTKLKEALS